MPHPIVEEFARYATLTTNSGYEMNAAHVPELAAAIAHYCTDIETLIASQPAFFATFDYTWAANPQNYNHPLEAQLQFGVLLIISEIAPNHRDYSRLGNICVRTLASRHINMEAVVRGPYKYIVVATSMIRMLQAWAVTIREVADVGRAAPEDVPVICGANYFGGQWMERAVRSNWPAVTPVLDYLIDTCVAYRLGKIPERTFALTDKPDASLTGATLFLFVGEMFFVCHELVHILQHSDTAGARSDDEELEADRWAASLFIIFQSRIVRWHTGKGHDAMASEPLLLGAVSNGPAIFFTVMHTLLFIERLTVASTEDADATSKLAVIKTEFDLNRRRTIAFQDALRSVRLRSHIGIYQASLQQLDVISVACRMRLAERYALPAEISLDGNLFRGFPEGS